MNDSGNVGMISTKMPHSHSTPAGVDGGSRTPPTTPRKAGKMLAVRVQMLDDTITMFQVQAKALGRVLFDQVCKQLHLLEADYFGLEYQEPKGPKYWLDLEKPVCRQVGLSLVDPLLRFCVKFYTPDPGQLEEEFTRYLFCLQIKRDLAHGLLQCNDNTAALMASYIVQAECGDYVIEDYPDHTYLSTYKFVPHQDQELERRIMENHKKHATQSPAEADLNLLETARRCELYGMKMHPAKDHEGVPLNLAVAHMGIIVFQNYTKINTFSWAKIRKISFKRKRFLIKLHPEGYGYYKDTVEFFFEGRNECKNFWKKCVENHGFFRCSVVKRVLRQKTRVLSRGSSFRYSGKTQKQIVEFVRDNYVKRQTFQRSNSFRQTSGGRALQGSEGGGYRGATPSSSLMGSSSISAHPLLPLGDPALGTPALSLSCGSMTLDSPTTVTSVSMGGTNHRRDDTAMSYRTLTSIDVHSPATPNQGQSHRHTMGAHQQQQQRITSSTGRISPSNISPPEFPPPRPLPRHSWQRSSSCRDLYASSFEDSGRARPNPETTGLDITQLPSQGELDNPVTRYDETNRSYSAASSKLPSLDHDSVPERIYSSSYPGTSSLSTESGHEESGPGADLSHDDLSHDSYELLEREHEFEYPESCSSPHDEALSDQSDEGIEQEMFQMDSETDSFVKHKSIKSTDKQIFKSVLADIKNIKSKSEKSSNNIIISESRIQRSSTQIERKFEHKHANSMDHMGKPPLPYQDNIRKDPIVLQVQKQKMTVLNEIKNIKPKYKITHVDSEVLRDEGIMRPKSRIDDDLSPVDTNRTILDQYRPRTIRARSIASLEDHSYRSTIETGSLGRTHRDKKIMSKERKSFEREERKRIERENSREIRRLERLEKEIRRSIEKLDSRERSYERLDSKERNERKEHRVKSIERIDSRELRKSMEALDRSPKERGSLHHRDSRERRERSVERLDSRESRKSPKSFENERHTLERFDSSKNSPCERHSPREPPRRKSSEKLELREIRPTFDFDPRTIERLNSLEKIEQFERSNNEKKSERKSTDRRSSIKSDSKEKKSFEKEDSKETKNTDSFDKSVSEKIGISRKNSKKDMKDDIPRERDDWRSLEKARKEEERRERDRQARVFMESRTETIIGLPNELECMKLKTGFSEYNPKVVGGVIVGFDDSVLPGHTPVERTKSDPNPGRPRIGSNGKRHMLMHQKSIDLTPADSADEDAFSDGTSGKKVNSEISYTLHKRHVMNGTGVDDKSESDSGKNSKISKSMDLPKIPVKQVTDVSLLDLTNLPPTPTPIVKLIAEKPKSILVSPDKSKSPKLLSPKLSPTEPKIIRIPPAKSPPPGILKNSPSRTPTKSIPFDKIKAEIANKSSSTRKNSMKLSPTEPNITIVSVIEKLSPKKSSVDSNVTIQNLLSKKKNKSPEVSPKSEPLCEMSPTKPPISFADIVEMKQEIEKRGQEIEKETLAVPDNYLEKQDSIEKIPLPEIPMKTTSKPPLPVKTEKPVIPSKDHLISKDKESESQKSLENKTSPKPGASPKKKSDKPKILEKPSIPEKTKRILDRIESRFSEINKNSPTKVSRPKIIDTGYDDFVDPVAELPLDDVPVKPAFELDSLKVPDFNPFMLRPHAEPLRSKSLSLAEEKAPIDTLLSPEMENKHFVQDVSPKKLKKAKSEQKKDFKKQSKSLEGDKPEKSYPLKKSGSKESRVSPATSKIDKSKLKLGEMPQEIIIIDSTDVEPEISIVQKGRSKSVTRLPDRSFSSSKDEELKKPRAKSASVDDELIKGIGGGLKAENRRPKSLGISKSLSNTDRDSVEKVSPKRVSRMKSVDGKISPNRRSPSRSPATRSPVEPKEMIFIEESAEEVKIIETLAAQVEIIEIKHEELEKIKVKEEQVEVSGAEKSEEIELRVDEISEKIEIKSEHREKSLPRQQTIKSPTVSRKVGETPTLFAGARLGLSEGSGIGALQRQSHAILSPTSQRRAVSLDAPIVALHKLPPANAFSSKDDTVEEPDNQLPDIVERREEPPKTLRLETSPIPQSESTDITQIPEISTDSLSLTEPSNQYLESPSTEIKEIINCPDLIPYEQENQSTIRKSSKEGNIKLPVGETACRFIDQSSVESCADIDIIQDSNRVDKISILNEEKKSEINNQKSENSSGTDSSGNGNVDRGQKMKTIGSSLSITTDEITPRGSIEKDDVPNVTVSIVEEEIEYLHHEDPPDMVKSPIQISIEECSDIEEPLSEDQNEILELACFDGKQSEKSRLDSGDTSEDTLDALDVQGGMRDIDSDISSPDYIDKNDEKTLVEVELTPEYLEMRKEDMEDAEELPEDEPSKHDEIDDPYRLSIDRKSRLSTERSRSEETNTYTPDREDPDSSSCSIARPLGIGQIQPIFDHREIAMIREGRKGVNCGNGGSLEDESSSISNPVGKLDLSSTWKPFPLESSASSSLEDAGWIPPDDNQHHQLQSEDGNNQNEDSFQEDLADYTGVVAYAIGPEIMANYGAFALSRTLSRISERSTTSEQDKSDMEDSFKPSSRSPSLDDESLISSDHQPSLSSDPPSGTALPSVSEDRRTSSELPDIPIDILGHEDDSKSPRTRRARLQLQSSEDWPSPPSSPLFDTPVMSHVETFYMEIKPEEAVKVTVTDSTETPKADSDSSDENQTLHDDLHSTLFEDCQSSTSGTTIDGTVKVAVKLRRNSNITGSSHSEDTSMGLSMSEWSSSNNTVRQYCQYSGGKSDDNSLAELGASISDWSGSTTVIPQQYYASGTTEKSQSDTTTSDKSVTSMRPNSKCQHSLEDLNDEDVAGGYEDPPEYHQVMLDDENRDEFDEARKFVENQFDEHRRRFDDDQNNLVVYADISPPQITFQSEYDEIMDEDLEFGALPSIPGPIPEEDEEDQLYDNVPAMKYATGEQIRMKVSPGDSSEDMHERYANIASRSRSRDDEWTFDDRREHDKQLKMAHKIDRGYSDPRHTTRSTERPVIVPIRAKSTPYYSTTSLSGESTTSSPPMQIRTQIRTKTMYTACRSPQSEGDTSSSMDSPAHTPDRGQRAFRRKRQQNAKRRHRVIADFEMKDVPIVSSTDSSFDVTTIPPPLLPEPNIDDDDDDDDDEHKVVITTDGTTQMDGEDVKDSPKVENNNSFFVNGKAEKPTNGVADINVNVNIINTPELSPEKIMKNGDIEDPEMRKTKRWPTDKAYYIAKELLMTERTYKKDLDVINVWFREEVSRESDLEGEAAVGLIELLADAHGPCLQEMESRLARWESNSRHNIGDFLYNTLLNVLPLYDQYLGNLIPVLEKLEYSIRTSRRFDQLCRDFESQKYCYLPLSSFLLKPLQRLLHYNSIIDRLLDHYPKDHIDFEDCLAGRDRLGETLLEGLTVLNQAENLVQLCELQRDISGFDNLVQEGRRFIRQGCLQKYNHKGFQQRMFFLFSDILLYTFRTQQPTQCFRVHGQLPLKGITIQDGDNKTGSDFVFVIIGQGNQTLTVAANNEEEKERWLEDISMAISQANTAEGKTPYLALKSCILGSTDEVGAGIGLELDRSSCGGAKASQRSNTTVHVCWHRNTSISYSDQLRAFQNQLSGFLLRKFKNSNGWQKLWVVFTNFCLFFYKSHQDDFPLASLPLLGYAVSTPTEKDGINKDFVFKLQFKNHVYFFRAESDFTFGRWMEVIRSATQQSHIPVNFSRKENY